MIIMESAFILQPYTVFIGWKEHIHIYGLIVFVIGITYFLTYLVIRWAITLQLTRTVSYVLTVLILMIGTYMYTTISSHNTHVAMAFQTLFESIVLFGGLLLVYMSIRALIKKQKT